MKKLMRSRRSKNLGDVEVYEIVELLDGWNERKLTWQLLIDQIFNQHHQRYSRQTLYNHTRVREAFLIRKRALVCGVGEASSITPELKRIAKLEAENQRLRMENNNLLEQFNRWVYNAYLRQMDSKMRDLMNSPLPPIYRDRS